VIRGHLAARDHGLMDPAPASYIIGLPGARHARGPSDRLHPRGPQHLVFMNTALLGLVDRNGKGLTHLAGAKVVSGLDTYGARTPKRERADTLSPKGTGPRAFTDTSFPLAASSVMRSDARPRSIERLVVCQLPRSVGHIAASCISDRMPVCEIN
jgi:hypothetical protein